MLQVTSSTACRNLTAGRFRAISTAMLGYFDFGSRLNPLVDKFVTSYADKAQIQHIDRIYLPSRTDIIRMTEGLLELVYPGFLGRQHLTRHNVAYHVGDLLPRVGDLVFRQVFNCLCCAQESDASPERSEGPDQTVGAGIPYSSPSSCEDKARKLTLEFLERLPAMRDWLDGDVQAAFDGDPAARNTDEIILAYPGLFAISVYRLAHEFFRLDVPLLPRVMTEWAHRMTGVDIHPGATIGRNLFIDHATGVVIGETTVIGNDVKIYQGVTLGALSIPKDERGRAIRGQKRHPTVEDNVTIYANAIVLGGDTVIGEGSVVGGSVFLTSSVPPGCTVTFKPPELHYRNRRTPSVTDTSSNQDSPTLPDYQI